MKVVQINTVANYGSTGRIAEEIGNLLLENGHESFIAHGSHVAHGGKKPESYSELIKVGREIDSYYHGAYTLLTDRHGFGSKRATQNLIQKLKNIKPDLVALHNLHGYYINIEILFNYIKEENIPIVWTFHDCWPFTGHCSHFENINCIKWQTHCENCPKTSNYPKSFIDRSYYNFEDKKRIFQGVNNLKIITPSHWLSTLVKKSFLQQYDVEVIHNGIDLDIFKLHKSKYNTDDKIVLGVASTWGTSKGLEDFIRLRKLLPSDFKIVLIGLNRKQIKNLPENILGIIRTQNIKELVEWYNKAYIFVNPTYSDNFPTTNIEALACGTPVITYDTGGSPEAIDEETGAVVNKGDIEGLTKAILSISKNSYIIGACRNRAVKFYNKKERYIEYLTIYLNSIK